jgi:hypothetical protein
MRAMQQERMSDLAPNARGREPQPAWDRCKPSALPDDDAMATGETRSAEPADRRLKTAPG